MTRPLLQALIPLGSVGAATALTWLLWSHIQRSSTPLFFVAVMASAMYCGALAGFIATCLSTVAIAAGWKPLQRYIEEAPDLRVSHALCPDCSRSVYPEFHSS